MGKITGLLLVMNG